MCSASFLPSFIVIGFSFYGRKVGFFENTLYIVHTYIIRN